MFGLIQDEVLERFKKFREAQAGMEAVTPNGAGKVAGKQIYQGRMEILVDHGVSVGGIRIVTAYPIHQVEVRR